jgi:glycosyltransferase involved in cell wall biosynthesis
MTPLNTLPLFSVLSANYNRGGYIAEMIESVLAQSYQNLELVIVDDGSTDNSVEIIKKYTQRDSRVKLFQQPVNKGCGNAMHVCAAVASGELMGYVGSDDALHKEAVHSMVTAHNNNPSCSLIYTTHYICDENMQVQRKAYGAVAVPANESYLSYGKGVTSFATFTRIHYQKTSGVNPNYKRAVDQDLYYKLEEVGDLLFIDEPLYYYRVNASGISTKKNISKARYWFVRAKEDAYQRRLLKSGTKNIKRSELNAWWSIMYVTKSSAAFQQYKFCMGFYWLGLSFQKSTFDKYFFVKLQSFFLNTWLHKAYGKLKQVWKKQS